MAKSPEIPVQDPVHESDSEADETEVSEPETPNLQKPADSESGSESDSDSDSDSDSEPDSPPTNVKPQPSPSAKAGPSTGSKRLAAPSLTEGAETKRLKKASATEEGKRSFERVFAPEDELLLLQELLKTHPSPQMDGLFEALKSKVSVPVSKAQVQDKIRRLKTKFFNKRERAAKKGTSNVEENGKDELETMVYQLSEKLWGNEEGPKSKGPTRIALRFEEAMGKDEKKKDVSYYASNGRSVDEWIFKEGTGLLPEEARSELEKQWKKIRMDEARLYVERLELSIQHAKRVHDAI